MTAVSNDKEASFIELGAGGMEVRRFDLRSAIDTQRAILLKFLTILKHKTMETEEKFREDARTAQPLSAIRRSTFNYNIDKAHPETDGMHLHNAKELQKQLGFFRRAFEEVGRLNQWISGDLDSMDYAAAQVVAFHEADGTNHRLTPKDVGIFLSFLAHRFDRLIVYVDEIESDINDSTN